MPVVELAGVTKAYENKIAVNNLSLSIEAGQMFGLLGPNGAGKTSSIRMMMGITLPDSGSINLFDKPFERQSLEQKIQFIAPLLHAPQLIVMDEPFAGLDPVNAVLVEQTLLELKAQGKAILFSTHRMDQVEKLCDSICLINNGQAVPSGNLREIKKGYERDHVIVEFEGDPAFLKSEEIAEAKNFSGHAEIKLKPHGNAQKLLHEAAAVATIYRFELIEPSLEEIFIQTVGGKNHA